MFERNGSLVPIQLADGERQLGGDPSQLTVCSALYWNERGAHFVVCKVAASRYRCLLYYSEATQYGTGRDEYDSLENCALMLLQVQSDHERELSNISSGAAAANLKDDDYHDPLVI